MKIRTLVNRDTERRLMIQGVRLTQGYQFSYWDYSENWIFWRKPFLMTVA